MRPWRRHLGGRFRSKKAATFAADVLPIIETLRASGVWDLRGLAAALKTRLAKGIH
jgi:hypothetical protein